ncbi:unnamed protein product [Pelagomonas calceolata]|uniref:GCK domain-containing protein n=1 Tax=Pelagomonas calceolata TaxID=35677 RepID=A0A8J2SSM4_9STRA|nr:unnamed protein product [Pelagomonas calceolata]
MLRTLAARGGAALAATIPYAAAEQSTEAPRQRKTSSLQRRNSVAAPAAQLQRRQTTATPPQTTATPPPEKPKPTPDTAPRVGVFLDDASRKRLAEKWPDKDSTTALFVLDEGLEKRPEMYGSLYGERATVRVVGADSDGALRGACLCDGTEVKASGSTTAVLKIGEAAFNHAEPKKAVEGSSGDPWPPTNEAPLSGTVCRADFWRDETCLVEPSLKCPLCQFMEDSPCAAVFKVWEACLDDVEAKNGEQDKEKKEADFAVACAEPTLALKACVEKYPDYFGEMFGAGESAAPASEPAPPAP